MSETAERLLDQAERRFRLEGYNAVSFRQLADEIGVKSASVHYHFPTKEALGVAVVERYAARIVAALGDPAEGPGPADRVGRIIEVFRTARMVEERICLCGMLGAEAEGLPPSVRASVNEFFKMSLGWLQVALNVPGVSSKAAHGRALTILAMLEGAMVISGSMRDPEGFEEVCRQARALASAPY